MNPQKVVISENLTETLATAIAECEHDRTFILVDETTERCCLPIVSDMDCVRGAQTIIIGATDTNKTLESLSHVWEALGEGGATRHSLLINIGGGMVTDLGGFAASTFKRGINYINIPTTLLAMVDASVGGKTGINFRGLKNEVGVFSNASTVILDTIFLKTLDAENIRSGYAEMLKHGLISNEQMWAELVTFELENPDFSKLSRMLADSVAVKQRIVTEDPLELGIRKALNLGHTAGHAFESFALKQKPILHGYAVAYGLICELFLSTIKTDFPSDKMHQTVSFIKERYGKMTITCDDYPTLLELMTHDKKNVAGTINFTLLGGIGDIRINQTATKEEIYEALDFYREC
ncbi:MAG: 3-dehydroquinate synthase [Prevotella sp.]|nr:3-dehydroquinate synthase [Prevotella sp.]